MRLLLVEDERVLRQQLALGLKRAGYAVDEADNGQDALFFGDTENYDSVILDLGLPGMDGLTVLKRWR
ncbi:MAG: response regulator, partial [Azoarcus sp.]|nr:response regulator [Azoarcus sp.]